MVQEAEEEVVYWHVHKVYDSSFELSLNCFGHSPLAVATMITALNIMSRCIFQGQDSQVLRCLEVLGFLGKL